MYTRSELSSLLAIFENMDQHMIDQTCLPKLALEDHMDPHMGAKEPRGESPKFAPAQRGPYLCF